MSKKIVILILIFVLILGAGGFFYWWENREIKGSPADWVIKETPEGTIVENKKAGLTLKAPAGWGTKKMEVEEGAILLSSSGAEIEWRDGKIVLPIKKGCMTQSNVLYKKMTPEQVKDEARASHFLMGVKSEEFKERSINNYRAIENTFDIQTLGMNIGVYIPLENIIYSFYLNWGPNDKENCIQEFNKFLETVQLQ